MNRPRLVAVSSAVVLVLPLWWILGLDQLTWLIAGFIVGFALLFRVTHPYLTVAAGVFLAVVLVSGVTGAEGIRWLTFAREALIVSAFFAALLGVGSLAASRIPLKPLLLVVCSVVAASSVLSLAAMAVQNPLTFTTPIAPLVPEVIAETGLGRASLVERSLGETSYFLGVTFLRPQGFFLFSTSQAVAQATTVPLLLALADWYPRFRSSLQVAALVTLVALIASTSRMPMIGLLVAFTFVWFVRQFQKGAMTLTLPLRGRGLAKVLSAVVLVLALAVLSGVAAAAFDFLTTRSLEGRAELYERTLEDWGERPLLGWGTDRDWTPRPEPSPSPTATPTPTPTPAPTPTPPSGPPPELPPLGSHSQYLGILFKQGVLGLGAYLAIVAFVLRDVRRLLQLNNRAPDWLVIGLLASLVAGVTESHWLDPGTAVIVGMEWGLLVGISRSYRTAAVSAGNGFDQPV